MTDVLVAKGVVCLGEGAAPGAQRLGFAPRAVVLWWSCQAHDGVASGNCGGVGFAAAGAQGGAISWVSEDGSPTARTASWVEETSIVGLAEAEASAPALRAEVDFAEDGFAFRVLTASPRWRVHYLALGGEKVQASSGLVSAPSAPGAQRIDLGIRPDLVLFASAAVDRPSSLARTLSIALGASSGPAAQVSAAFFVLDGANPGSVGGAQRSDAAIVSVREGVELDALARVRGFDQDGVVLQWTRNPSTPRQVLYLALAGVCCAVGSGSSPKVPRRRRTRVIGLRPRGLICFSWGLDSSPAARSIGRLALGGATSTASGVTSWDDCNQHSSMTSTHVQSSTDHVLLVADSQTGGLHAAASLASFNSGGLTFDWSRSDGVRRQYVYAAVGVRRHSRMRTAVAWLRSHLPH